MACLIACHVQGTYVVQQHEVLSTNTSSTLGIFVHTMSTEYELYASMNLYTFSLHGGCVVLWLNKAYNDSIQVNIGPALHQVLPIAMIHTDVINTIQTKSIMDKEQLYSTKGILCLRSGIHLV